jgi:hypothetical protein
MNQMPYLYHMNRLFIFCVFPFLLNAQPVSKKIRVLFLGNSYTFVNNLPQLIKDVALAQGDTLIFDSHLPGGYTFNNHCYNATSLTKISAGNWDYVVLQAQSQEPAFSPSQVNSQTLPFAIKLDSLVKQFNPCANTVFYETWGRKFGDVANCPFYPPVCTYTGMQNRLKESYKLFADTVNDVMAPVGEAFRKVISTNTLINLYQSDDSHPSLEGSYLAACVFYETLFQRSVLSNTFNPGISTNTLSVLNQAAHQTVADSLMTWNIPKYIPKAELSYTAQSSSSFQFESKSGNFLSKWYFGDGSSSVSNNPIHTYSLTGNYTVSLVVYDFTSCKKDSVSTLISAISTTGINEEAERILYKLFPNPCSDVLTISNVSGSSTEGTRITVYSVYGALIKNLDYADQVNFSDLPSGVYNLIIQKDQKRAYFKFIKN